MANQRLTTGALLVMKFLQLNIQLENDFLLLAIHTWQHHGKSNITSCCMYLIGGIACNSITDLSRVLNQLKAKQMIHPMLRNVIAWCCPMARAHFRVRKYLTSLYTHCAFLYLLSACMLGTQMNKLIETESLKENSIVRVDRVMVNSIDKQNGR